MHIKKFLVAVCLALIGAGNAQAVNISVSKTAIDTRYSVMYNGKSIFAGPMDLTIASSGPIGSSKIIPKVLRVWCIDLQHEITLGVKNPALTFKVTTLDELFPKYSNLQLDQLAWIIHEGSTRNPFVRMDAMFQVSIWDYIQPGAVTGPSAVLQNYAASMATTGNTFDHTRIRGYLSRDGLQSFAGMVPEPAPWAMMIGGFGLVGGITRRSRSKRSFNTVVC